MDHYHNSEAPVALDREEFSQVEEKPHAVSVKQCVAGVFGLACVVAVAVSMQSGEPASYESMFASSASALIPNTVASRPTSKYNNTFRGQPSQFTLFFHMTSLQKNEV